MKEFCEYSTIFDQIIGLRSNKPLKRFSELYIEYPERYFEHLEYLQISDGQDLSLYPITFIFIPFFLRASTAAST